MTSLTLPLDELVDGAAARLDIAGVPVCVVRLGDEVFAINDICSHGQVSLSGGEVWPDEHEIECPQHSSTFDLTTGRPTCLPATQPVAVYDVTIDDGQVTIGGVTAGEETT